MDPLSLQTRTDEQQPSPALQTQPVRKVVSQNPQLSLAGTPMVNAAASGAPGAPGGPTESQMSSLMGSAQGTPAGGLTPDPNKMRPYGDVPSGNPNAGKPGYDLVGERLLGDNPGGPGAPPAATTTAPPLPTEYPSAPSTTGQPQNRLQLAENAWDTFARSTAPQYTADLREATQKAAGMGQIGSGGLRTTYGNLANQRALALDTQRDNLINAATTATIGDQQAGRGLDIQQQGADTSRIGVTGNLDLQRKAQDIDAAFKAGTMTLAQKDQALRELQNQQQYGMEGQKLELAREGQSANIANQQGQLQLAKDQLAQTGAQFGLSLAQQKELATLADKTQNRQLDISGAQGQQALLLELARIMGRKDTNLDPNFLASVAKALGINTPSAPGAAAAPAAASSGGLGSAVDSLPPELRGAAERYRARSQPVAGAGYQVAS